MTTTVYQKTDKGQEEIRTRAHRLDQRHRALLLMVNGEKTCDEILVQLQPLGFDQSVFGALEQDGYIRLHSAESVAHAKSVSLSTSAAAAASTPTPNSAPAAAGGGGDEGYQRLYRIYTENISRYIGLRGYLLEMKVEKAANVADLVALRDSLKTSLVKTRGEPETSNVIAQLDLLIDEATN